MQDLEKIIPHPSMRYPGGKGAPGAYHTIINHIPKCDVFVEAMVGGGAVFKHLNTDCRIVINDCDSSCIDAYDYASCYPGLNIYNVDYADLIAKYGYAGLGKVVMFFDPPYMLPTRKNGSLLYTHEWQLKDHERFLTAIQDVPFHVMITHPYHALYASALNHFYRVPFTYKIRHGMMNDLLWMNFPPPTELQDYRYIGKDFTDRQRIQRKIKREIDKLSELEPLERNAIIQAITTHSFNQK
jgi:DNA adenine methylase